MTNLRLPVCCLLIISGVTHANEPSFRWKRAITLPALTEAAPIGIPLDEHVHAETRREWPDLRVRDAQGRNVGVLRQSLQETEPRPYVRQYAVASMSAKVKPEFGLRIQVALGKDDPVPDALVIETRMRDFELQVQAEATVNGKDWLPAGPPVLIFDYSRFIDARNLVIPVNATDQRTFRLTINDVTAEQESQLLELTRRLADGRVLEQTERLSIQRRPFHIDKVLFQRTIIETRTLAERQQVYRTPTFKVEEDVAFKRTVATIETHGQPITALRLVTPAKNFSRRYEWAYERLDRRGDPKWTVTGQGTLVRFAVGTVAREELTATGTAEGIFGDVSGQDRRPARLRLTIENGDSPPLPIEAIEALGPVYELRCLASPGDVLQLEYGAEEVEPATLDTAALQAALQSETKILTVTLGEPQAQQIAPAAAKPWIPWNDTRVIVGVIVALTVLLGAGLYQASRRMNDLPSPPPDPS
jgi:hypothetical protein